MGDVSRDAAWLEGSVLDVAPRLLGAHVTTTLPDGVVTVRLTEVEAYDGERDPGSHAFRGPTRRNGVMFGRAGHLYVYRHMGLHHCVNVVTGVEGRASAVLLRAGEVVEGVEVARRRRLASGVLRDDVDLARGPARLTVSLGLDLSFDGEDVLRGEGRVTLAAGTAPSAVRTGPRVGVAGDGGDPQRFPWRFWLADEPTVSAFRPGVRRARRPPVVGPAADDGEGASARTAD